MNVFDAATRAARLGRDVRAVRKGPAAVVKRQARKAVYRRVNGQTASLLRRIGL